MNPEFITVAIAPSLPSGGNSHRRCAAGLVWRLPGGKAMRAARRIPPRASSRRVYLPALFPRRVWIPIAIYYTLRALSRWTAKVDPHWMSVYANALKLRTIFLAHADPQHREKTHKSVLFKRPGGQCETMRRTVLPLAVCHDDRRLHSP
jgi:hypothetical protein